MDSDEDIRSARATRRDLLLLENEWMAARLAHALSVMGRLGHDLRGILSPALLAGERLQRHSDPAVRRSADSIMRSVDRATDAMRDTMAALREDTAWRPLGPVPLRAAIRVRRDVRVVNRIPEQAVVVAEITALTLAFDRGIACLWRAGATRIEVDAQLQAGMWSVRLRADVNGDWPAHFTAHCATARTEAATFVEWLASLGVEPPKAAADGLLVLLRAR